MIGLVLVLVALCILAFVVVYFVALNRRCSNLRSIYSFWVNRNNKVRACYLVQTPHTHTHARTTTTTHTHTHTPARPRLHPGMFATCI